MFLSIASIAAMMSSLSVPDPVTGAHHMARRQALSSMNCADNENYFYKPQHCIVLLEIIGASGRFLQVFAPCLILLM
jgi:hypothetical protein